MYDYVYMYRKKCDIDLYGENIDTEFIAWYLFLGTDCQIVGN